MQQRTLKNTPSEINHLLSFSGKDNRRKLAVLFFNMCSMILNEENPWFQLTAEKIEECLNFLKKDIDTYFEVIKKVLWKLVVTANDYNNNLAIFFKSSNINTLLYCTLLATASIKSMEADKTKDLKKEITQLSHKRDLLLAKIVKQVETEAMDDVFLAFIANLQYEKPDLLQDLHKSIVFSSLIDAIKKRNFTETQIFEHCLLFATSSNSATCVKYLLENKVDPNTSHISSSMIADDKKMACTVAPFFLAVTSKKPGTNELVNLLIEHKANVNLVFTDVTSESGHTRSVVGPENTAQIEKVKQDIQKGKALYSHIQVQYGFTPLIFVASEGTSDMMARLLKEPVNINATTLNGHSALFYAAHRNAFDMVNLLLKQGADPFLTDHYGLSPIDITNDIDIKNCIKRYIVKYHFEDLTKTSQELKIATNDLINQLHPHVNYQNGEISLDAQSLLKQAKRGNAKENKELLGTLGKLSNVQFTDELLNTVQIKITQIKSTKVSWTNLLNLILQSSQEYHSIEAVNKVTSPEPKTLICPETKPEPELATTDNSQLYSAIVNATSINISSIELKADNNDVTKKSGDKSKGSTTQIELNFLMQELKSTPPTSIAQLIERTNAMLYAFGSLMRKIIKLHEDFTATTVDTLFPAKLAQQLSNINFHSHRSPLFFMGGNLRATRRYCNAIFSMVKEIMEQIQNNPRPENDPEKMAIKIKSPLFHQLRTHAIPDTTDYDCISQLTLVIRELKLYERSAKEELKMDKTTDPLRKQFAKNFTLCARAAPYLKWHLVLNLNNAYPEIHNKLMVMLPLLISEGEINIVDQKNMHKTFQRVVEHIQQMGAILRHPTVNSSNALTLARVGILPTPISSSNINGVTTSQLNL